MSVFKRNAGSTEWHWDESCLNWPTQNFEIRKVRPDGPFCKRCEAGGRP